MRKCIGTSGGIFRSDIWTVSLWEVPDGDTTNLRAIYYVSLANMLSKFYYYPETVLSISSPDELKGKAIPRISREFSGAFSLFTQRFDDLSKQTLPSGFTRIGSKYIRSEPHGLSSVLELSKPRIKNQRNVVNFNISIEFPSPHGKGVISYRGSKVPLGENGYTQYVVQQQRHWFPLFLSHYKGL